MAIVKCLPIYTAAHLQHLIDYVQKDNKTAEKEFVTSSDCQLESAYSDFSLVKRTAQKEGGILAHQIIQSFKIGEISPEDAHELSCRFAEESFFGFQYTVSTHIDRSHIHSHIVINSVSALTGGKYHSNLSSLALLRKSSDALCKEYGLSIIEEQSGYRSLDKSTYELASKGRSWKVKLASDLDAALEQSHSIDEFNEFLYKCGYDVLWKPKNVTIGLQNGKRIRLDTLAKQFGKQYMKCEIEKHFGQEVFEDSPNTFTRTAEAEDTNTCFSKAEQNKPFIPQTIEQLDFHAYMTVGNISKYKLINSNGETSVLKVKPSDVAKLNELGIFFSGTISEKYTSVYFKSVNNSAVAKALNIDENKIKSVSENNASRKADRLIKEMSKLQNKVLTRLNFSENEIKLLSENDIAYAFYRDGDTYRALIFRDDLKRVCELTGKNYEEELSRILYCDNMKSYHKIKQLSEAKNEPIAYRIVDKNGLEKLENSNLNFAYFAKENGKYNVAFLSGDVEIYKSVFQNNAPNREQEQDNSRSKNRRL